MRDDDVVDLEDIAVVDIAAPLLLRARLVASFDALVRTPLGAGIHALGRRRVPGGDFAAVPPQLEVDADSVAFGAATHDIGKARVPSELSAPGSSHEVLGESLLLAAAVPPARARFARTHGLPPAELGLDDALVALADKAWKGKREKGLEDRVVALVAAATGAPAWDVFMRLDGIVQRLARDADARLQWQGRFSI